MRSNDDMGVTKEMDPLIALREAQMYEKEAEDLDWVEVMAYFSNQGVPLEVVTRMETLWQQTIRCGNKIIHIGRAIIGRIIGFLEKHPNMAIGIALGLSLGHLANAIPFIGSIIAPIITIIGSALGSVYGYRIDQITSGNVADSSIFESAIRAVKEFWDLFCDVFRILVVEPVTH